MEGKRLVDAVMPCHAHVTDGVMDMSGPIQACSRPAVEFAGFRMGVSVCCDGGGGVVGLVTDGTISFGGSKHVDVVIEGASGDGVMMINS